MQVRLGRANIVDCGFLSEKEGFFLIGPFGMGDPAKFNELYDHGKYAMQFGYLGISSDGEPIEIIG